MTSALLPFRGGYYTHPFGASWFIVEFLRGNSPEGSERIDPSRGAHQAHIHNQYKQALRFAIAEDQAQRDQEKWIEAEKPLSDAEMQLRRDYYHSRLPARLHRMRYSSFTVYFALLKRLGWVEATGEQRPSEPQDYDPNFQPRTYYRLTPLGLTTDVPMVFDPVMVLYPHYTREQRSPKKRRIRVPGPLRPPRAPAPEAPEVPRLMTQAEADAAFARQAEAEQAEAAAEEATTEEAEPAGEIPPFTLDPTPGKRTAQALRNHLVELEKLDPEAPEVKAEFERLAEDLQPWIKLAEEGLAQEENKENPDPDREDALREKLAALEEAQTALENREVSDALQSLETAYPPPAPRKPRVKKSKT